LDARQQTRAEALAADLRAREARITDTERMFEERAAYDVLDNLEARRDLSRTHCVVDMDMFFAAVELRDQPQLSTKPVAIGGMGMISTANYVARLYGVRSAMPGFIAAEMVRNPKLVGSSMPPAELIFIKPDFDKYTKVALETRKVFREYDANFHAGSLDEAYMDLTECLARRGEDAETVVAEMRRRITEKTGLTCSAGIAPNSLLAKICSDDEKPNGQTRIMPTRDAVLNYIEHLPVRRVCGVGKVLERQLKVILAVVTCGGLRRAACGVRRAFADRPKTCDFLLRASLGLSGGELAEDEGDVVGVVGRKSLSCERTFSTEADPNVLRARLREICQQVADDMASHDPPLAAKTVALKLKASSFELRNRQSQCQSFVGFAKTFHKTKGDGSTCEGDVLRVAEELVALTMPHLEAELPCQLRLMGVRVSSFRDAQTTLERGQQCLGRFLSRGEAQCRGHDDSVHASNKVECIDLSLPDVSGDGEPKTREVQRLRRDDEVSLSVCRTQSGPLPAGSVECVSIDDAVDPVDVQCPICGAQVAVHVADQHVNAHYEPAVPVIANKRKSDGVMGLLSGVRKVKK